MTLEAFFKKFDLFADAPDAVARMRELVLELAVRGQLLSIDQLNSSTPSDPSGPFAVPSDWRWITLNKAADCRAATKVDSATLDDSDWVLDLEDIDGKAGKIVAVLTFAERRSLSTKASFQENDVLYGKLRPYLNKVVIADRPGYCTTEIIPLRPQPFVSASFLRLFLRSPHFLKYATTKSYGMKMPRLGSKDLESTPMPLPPLAEQKRIVAKVDELMALCDRLEAQQKEREEKHAELSRASLARFADSPTPANLHFIFHKSYDIVPADLRKTILTLAVQGKLVPQNPNDEPAEELLARLEHKRELIAKEQSVRLPKNVPSVTAEDCPHEIPVSWQWSRIGRLALAIDYGTSKKADDDFSKVPVYRMGNIIGGRLVDENLKYVGAEIDDLPRLYLKAGDLLFNRTNSYELVGKVGIYTGPDDTATFASYLIRIRLPSTFLCPSFFNLAMNATYFRQTQIEPEVVQQCGQANFNGTKLASTALPVPPLAEQRRIVAKVDELMALVDALEMQLAASRTTAEKLLAALVAELTAGKTPPAAA